MKILIVIQSVILALVTYQQYTLKKELVTQQVKTDILYSIIQKEAEVARRTQ